MFTTLLAISAACCAVTMYTGSVWEDFLITVRFSQNLVSGNGLVYLAGEKVHGFTSVINTLLPAVFLWVGDVEDYERALAGYRLVSVLALLGGVAVLLHALRQDPATTGSARWFLTALLALDFKLAAFASNGMETGFLVGFLAVAVAIALKGVSKYWLLAGLTWAGLLYTRPDAPLYLAGLGLFSLWLHRDTRSAEFKGLAKCALLCGLLYLPWFTWTWWYYGSPVPHTIIAKAAIGQAAGGASAMKSVLAVWSWIPLQMAKVYLPIYGTPVLWWQPGAWAAVAAAAVAAMAAFSRRPDRATRGLALVFVGMVIYFALQQLRRTAFPWYFPPATLLASLVLSRQLAAPPNDLARRLRTVAAWVLILFLGITWYHGARCLRITQREVEYGNRMQVGLWLRSHIRTGDTVFAEPLGYIGYFSRARMRDYPGLVSPQTVAAIRNGPGDFASTGLLLKPDWMVLAGSEVPSFWERPEFRANYVQAAGFDVRPALAVHGRYPGDYVPASDAVFVVFKRQIPSGATEPKTGPGP